MRLTAIKLAGFKSFVDPTTIPVASELVGIVGPNGCGKSNVIDAVRWVLGETSAKHLRGESMQDVIFNGSTARKAVSRASVELVFDNSAGRAAGAWSQYAEISVKRVLTRNGESSYYINNLHVRRRDVADLFLGTGLGARAYAIIEQGMISRIIEARPEELRGFLEEAAGISKYKERRRETELRLKDSHDNLLRVEDVRQELGRQIEKLTAQAQVAQQYKALQTELEEARQFFFYAKKREAQAARGKLARDLGEAGNRLEAEVARLRESEKNLEAARAEHHDAQEAFNRSQGEYYAAQAEVGRIEQDLRHVRETRERVEREAGETGARLEQLGQREADMQAELAQWQGRAATLDETLAGAELQATRANETLPAREAALKEAQQAVGEAQRALALTEQNRQVDETHLAHARKTLQQLEERARRLEQELGHLPRPDTAALAQKEVEANSLTEAVARLQQELAALEARQPELEAARRASAQELERLRRELHQVEGERAALQKLQDSLKADEKLARWQEERGLRGEKLWQGLEVDHGWEAAVEAVLREALHGLSGRLDDAGTNPVPPARFFLFESGAAEAGAPGSLLEKMRAGELAAPLSEWLGGVRTADTLAHALQQRATLAPGERLVTPEGHVVTRHSVLFHGPHTAVESVLAQRRELERLGATAAQLEVDLAAATQAESAAAEALRANQTAMQSTRQQLSQAQGRQHQAQMEALRLQQAFERVQQRRTQIEGEQGEIARQQDAEKTEMAACEARLADHRSALEFAREGLYEKRQARDIADRALAEARELQRQAERSLQEARYLRESGQGKIAELSAGLEALARDLAGARTRLAALQEELARLDAAPLEESLQGALAQRQARETALSELRNRLEGINQRLRQEDEKRLACEQGLEPLRARMEQLRLKDQEWLLIESQQEENLRQAQADEEKLKARYETAPPRASALQGEIDRLGQAIAALGAVNLAALEELEQAQERSTYLDNQQRDLGEAVATLEAAIRKIDQETRERLKETFDTVNGHLGELFPQVFGGGHAELVLTGEELLDAGVQLTAQPPGKKNSTIHVLSGGEKAMTALSLVFSLFRLNPAPFCLLDEVDAPLDDSNTQRYCDLVRRMAEHTQFVFITHNRITMEMARQLAGVTMQEPGVSRIVAVDVVEALRIQAAA